MIPSVQLHLRFFRFILCIFLFSLLFVPHTSFHVLITPNSPFHVRDSHHNCIVHIYIYVYICICIYIIYICVCVCVCYFVLLLISHVSIMVLFIPLNIARFTPTSLETWNRFCYNPFLILYHYLANSQSYYIFYFLGNCLSEKVAYKRHITVNSK